MPVLSSTTVSTRCRFSSASAFLNSTPILAPRPVPTMMATGVASPSAQGQEITSTEMARFSENSSPYPAIIQTMNVTAAMLMTTGTNTPAILSASRAMGALEPPASSTMRMTCARVVSSPTLSARNSRYPSVLTVAAATLSPAPFSMGTLSPVRALWSTDALPSSTVPSTGMLLPERTMTTSPTATCSTGISTISPFLRTEAVLGLRSISERMASPVLPLARVSRNLPKVISVRIMAADSKYRFSL